MMLVVGQEEYLCSLKQYGQKNPGSTVAHLLVKPFFHRLHVGDRKDFAVSVGDRKGS